MRGCFRGLIGVVVLAKTRPALLARVGLPFARPNAIAVFNSEDGPPAIDPADPNLPDAVDPTEEAKIARIPHEDLRELIRALSTWRPKRHNDEEAFQRSFQRHLLQSGYAEPTITRHPRLRWTAEDRDPGSHDKRAVPDFSVKKVLVEIKRNITASAESDRALGQMARYCIAWRREGPAVLVVCNDFDRNLRTFVERTVRGWKAQGVPVMAYFARQASVESGDDEFLPETFKAPGT
jgi:hypothetical protein